MIKGLYRSDKNGNKVWVKSVVNNQVFFRVSGTFVVDSMTVEDFLEVHYLLEEYKDSVEPKLVEKKHNHYHKDVSKYETVDVYAICKIYDIEDPTGCIHHAIKKLLVTGKRGHKDRKTDLQNVVDTIQRLIELDEMDESDFITDDWRDYEE